MSVPKFKSGTLVKYKVHGQCRYNNVVDSYFSASNGQHMYSLDEPNARPLYLEEWLQAVSKEEEQWLRQLVGEGKLLFGETGYLYTENGEVYNK